MENRNNKINENVAWKSTNHLIPINGSHINMQAIEIGITDRGRGEIDNAVATIEIKVHDGVLAALDTLVMPRVKQAMRSVNASSGWDPGSVEIDSDQRGSSGNVNGLRMTA